MVMGWRPMLVGGALSVLILTSPATVTAVPGTGEDWFTGIPVTAQSSGSGSLDIVQFREEEGQLVTDALLTMPRMSGSMALSNAKVTWPVTDVSGSCSELHLEVTPRSAATALPAMKRVSVSLPGASEPDNLREDRVCRTATAIQNGAAPSEVLPLLNDLVRYFR